MVEPNVSTLDILKAQRARKAAARHQAEEQSESESESESEIPPQTSPTSTPPLVSTSAAGCQPRRAPSSEPPHGHPSQASQQPHARPSTLLFSCWSSATSSAFIRTSTTPPFPGFRTAACMSNSVNPKAAFLIIICQKTMSPQEKHYLITVCLMFLPLGYHFLSPGSRPFISLIIYMYVYVLASDYLLNSLHQSAIPMV